MATPDLELRGDRTGSPDPGRTHWQMREIGGGNRHENDLRQYFGLGNVTRAATVRIE